MPTPTSDDLKALTDDDLMALAVNVSAEQERRATLARVPQVIDDAVKAYQDAAGTTKADGAAWKQPTSSLDAYPAGATVTDGGKTWVSTTAANVWKPGTAGWREQSTTSTPAAWRQPTGAADAYRKGDRITWQGGTYTSLIDANTWSPADYPAGWKKES